MNELKIQIISKENYNPDNNEDELGKIIFEKRLEDNFQIIDKNNFYLVYKIKKINKILPNIDDNKFRSQIKKILYEKFKFEYNSELLKKINTNKFNDDDFVKLTNSKSAKIEKVQLESINDDKKFNINSIKLLYSMPLNSYTLVNDNNNNIYLTKIIKFYEKDISNMTENFESYQNLGNLKIKNNIFSSYDYFLNKKYKIKINEKTLERVKNYFR